MLLERSRCCVAQASASLTNRALQGVMLQLRNARRADMFDHVFQLIGEGV
jgi:hypothetical protein